MAGYKLISADSHVFEPQTMWIDYIEPEFRDKAPRIVTDPQGKKGDFLVTPGREPEKFGGSIAAGASPEELANLLEQAYFTQCPPGAYLPQERLKDMERDGSEAEVMYTTQGFGIFRLMDAPLQQALFRAYNTWLGEFCSYDPKRMIGLALISLLDVEEGVKELRRCAKLGLRGGVIMASPPDDLSYANPMYEPFWAAAAELEMPVSLHILTGHGPEANSVGKFKEDRYLRAVSLIHEIQRSMAEIIFSGILERHPSLKIVSAENDIGWVPHFLYRADHFHHKYKYAYGNKIDASPSELAKRQFFVTFMDDPAGLALTHIYGEDNFAWASDYPHAQSTFPNSHKIIEHNFAGISEEVKKKVTRTNAISLYNIDLN